MFDYVMLIHVHLSVNVALIIDWTGLCGGSYVLDNMVMMLQLSQLPVEYCKPIGWSKLIRLLTKSRLYSKLYLMLYISYMT